MPRRKKLTKDDLIRAEIQRLEALFSQMSTESRSFAQELIQNAAFMAVTLRDLQRIINETGYSSEYQNGENQFGTKKTPEVDIYNTMIKNFNTTMKQLQDLLPEGTARSQSEDDPLFAYIDKPVGRSP